MKKFTLFLFACSILSQGISQDLKAYQLFTHEGKAIQFDEMLVEIAKRDIVLFGELHDNPISHWLQLEILIGLANLKNRSVIVGAEMFERDNQLIIDEYFEGHITQGRFEAEARLWPNYKTDYKSILEYAREKSIKLIATNIPRRYASMVASGGFESLHNLSDRAKEHIAPLPIDYDPELPGYKAMLEMMGMPGRHGVNPANFPKAQAIKDATMAWSISQNHAENYVFIHLHGTYHSNNYEGIVWYLERYSPNLSFATLATVLQDDATQLLDKNKGLADFILVVPKRMTRTY